MQIFNFLESDNCHCNNSNNVDGLSATVIRGLTKTSRLKHFINSFTIATCSARFSPSRVRVRGEASVARNSLLGGLGLGVGLVLMCSLSQYVV